MQSDKGAEPAAGTMRATMVTTMRNEAPFILEWLVYHRLIGFTDFLVFTNDCEDGTDLVLDRLAEMGWLTHLPNPRRGKKTVQWQALSRAANQPVVKKADWLMVADVDEFLVIKRGAGHLADLIAAVPDPQGFLIPWRMFGSNGVVAYQPGLVTAQFTRAAPEALLWPWRAVQFKSLFRNGPHIARLGVHRPKLEAGAQGAWYDGNGNPPRQIAQTAVVDDGPRYGLAQLNHYALGSVQNFLVKTDRGRPNRSDEAIGLDYWVERNFDAVEDDAILVHLPAIRAGVARLLQDEVLRRLIDEAIAWRHRRIAELMLREDKFQLWSLIRQAGPSQPLEMAVQTELLAGARRAALQARRAAQGPDAGMR